MSVYSAYNFSLHLKPTSRRPRPLRGVQRDTHLACRGPGHVPSTTANRVPCCAGHRAWQCPTLVAAESASLGVPVTWVPASACPPAPWVPGRAGPTLGTDSSRASGQLPAPRCNPRLCVLPPGPSPSLVSPPVPSRRSSVPAALTTAPSCSTTRATCTACARPATPSSPAACCPRAAGGASCR